MQITQHATNVETVPQTVSIQQIQATKNYTVLWGAAAPSATPWIRHWPMALEGR